MVSLRIALRYLISKKSHSAVNIISFISMAGVAVATVAIVCVLSVFNGFRDIAESRLSSVDPELKVVPATGKIIAGGDSLACTISALPGVATALPTIEEQALAIVGPRQMAVRLKGVPSGYEKVSNIPSVIIDGTYDLHGATLGAAVVSVGTAIKLSAHPGDYTPLALYVPKRIGHINPANPMAAFRTDSLPVSGVYQVNETEKDASTVMVPLGIARDLLDYDSEASAIEIALKPGIDATTAKQAVTYAVGSGFTVLDRMEQEYNSFRMISIEKWITFIMLAFILLTASFNVISTLSMLMIEKRENMATLRALGARSSMIRGIFIWEGWLISLIGGLAGLVIGLMLCLLQQNFGLIKLAGNAEQLSIHTYPVRLAAPDLLIVMSLVALTGLFIAAVTSRFAPKSN